jgi:hypothetical protein
MSKLNYAGEYELSELILYSSSGNIVNLENSYSEINLYENMFSNTLSGTVLVVDTDGIIMNLPVTGQEHLSFKITTPSLDLHAIDYTEHLMSVFKIDGRIPTKSTEVFMLHFCSPELLTNKRVRVSKSYTNTIDKIVVDVLENSKAINTNKTIFVEKTKGIKKLVVPNKSPYGLIKDLATDAISGETGSPNYVFFENTQGIHFRTLESLYNKPSIGEFIASDRASIDFTTGGVMNVKEELKRVLEYQVSGNNDTLDNIESGMLASKTIEYDIFQKKYDVSYYNYFTDFYKYKRVSDNRGKDNPIYNDISIDENGKTMGDYSNAKIFMHPTSKDSEGNDAQHTGSYTPNDISKTISSRSAKHTELDNGVKIIMKVNGTTTLSTGAIIDFQIPITGKNHTNEEFDIYNSGRFLITKLRHTFIRKGTRHRILMTAVKDSFNMELPQNTEQPNPKGNKGSVIYT